MSSPACISFRKLPTSSKQFFESFSCRGLLCSWQKAPLLHFSGAQFPLHPPSVPTNTVSAHVEQNRQRSISRLITGIVRPRIHFACVPLISLAPDPHLVWLDGHFARGELEDIVCMLSMFVLPSSLWMFLWSAEVAEQQREITASR